MKYQWFDMIHSGIKKEEYREIKEFYASRLENKSYTYVRFHRGYSNKTILIECKGIEKGIGNPEWGAPDFEVYKIKLGNIIEDNTD